MMSTHLKTLTLTLIFCLLTWLILNPGIGGAQVLNEFLAINDSSFQDPFGEFDDWLELYNPSTVPVSLGGCFLTDDFTQPTRWVFPDTVISPGQFLLVWCDNDTDQGPLHANFALNGAGEHIGLFDPSGLVVLDSISYSQQAPDTSLGRLPDGANYWIQLPPTPGTANSPTAVIPPLLSTANLTSSFLYPCFPNPCNATTAISYQLQASSHVSLRVYDCAGRLVSTLVDGWRQEGSHELTFDAGDLPSGVYFCCFRVNEIDQIQKIILLK